MMFGKENCAVISKSRNFGSNGLSEVKLFAEPSGKDARERGEPPRSDGQVSFEHAHEFRDRFVVENDSIQVFWFEPRVSEAELDGINGKSLIMLFAGESLFLR